MEGFLFVIDPVWWNTTITWSSLCIALFGGIFIGISITYRQSKNISKSENIIPKQKMQFISLDDSHYAEKTLKEIREYLTNTHYPMHSWAHVPIDIRSYTTDNELISIIEKLEQIEFSGKISEQKIIEQIQKDLLRKFSS